MSVCCPHVVMHVLLKPDPGLHLPWAELPIARPFMPAAENGWQFPPAVPWESCKRKGSQGNHTHT